MPQNVFVPDYMFDSNDDLNLDVNLKEDDETHSFVSYNRTKLPFVYNDDTASLTSVDSTTVHLSQVPWKTLLRMHSRYLPKLNVST